MSSVKQFNKILIANRGEVAVRIIKACQKLNIASVAVYSEVDKLSNHVALAEEAVFLGGSIPAESYLNQQRILDAVKLTGADAVHPGFGFLAENAEFANLCHQAGVVFIGPSVEVMNTMASKSASKALVESLNIPVIPGIYSPDQSVENLKQLAQQIGYPVLIKASSGGGGMGMRVVKQQEEFESSLASCKHESLSAFADDQVLIEKYFPSIRHIEVQIVADSNGNILHCFERECSIQRRQQKVVE